MEAGGAQPSRPDPILTSAVWVVGLLAVVDVLAGLWAVRDVRRSRLTPDISDIDGAFFDPHGIRGVVALGVAAIAVVTLPPLLALLAGLWRQRRGVGVRRAVLAVLAGDGLFWVVTGFLSVRLDAAGARVVDPMLSGPKGPGLLGPLGYVLMVVGALCFVGLTALVGLRSRAPH